MSISNQEDTTLFASESQYCTQGSCTDECHYLYYRIQQEGDKFHVLLSRRSLSADGKRIANVRNMNFKSMMSLVQLINKGASENTKFFAKYLDAANQALLGPPSPTIFYDSDL